MMERVFVGFGANLGEPHLSLKRAQALLALTPGVLHLQTSPLYLSEPLLRKASVDKINSVAWYLNAVFALETNLQLTDFFVLLQTVEKQMGRTTGKGQWKPRVVDLDLLFYGDRIYQDADLHVPHLGLAERRFVLTPLCDLAPDFVHPEFGLPIKKLLELCDDPLKVVPYSE